jgi:hypothetical protein
MKAKLVVAAVVSLVIPMLGQTLAGRPYVVRAETITDNPPYSTLMNTCVLVYPDGQYRMEKSYDVIIGIDPKKTKVYLGTLSDGDLKNLELVLKDDKFVQIKTSLTPFKLSGRMDVLLVTVPRERSVQSLVFRDRFERKPFDKDLKAFSDALENIEKRKLAVAKTEKSNHCGMPLVRDGMAPAMSAPNSN